jgi:uncharacterized membrane protein YhaH (DUF805 family)
MDPKNPYRSPSSDLAPPATGVDKTHPLDPNGRFTRLSWLAWTLILGLAATPLFMGVAASGMLASPDAGPGAPILTMVGVLALDVVFFVLYLLFAIRRFHDIDASGWWSALLIVPLANFFAILVLAIKRGSPGPNRFGPPRPTPGWEQVLGYISIGFMVLGLIGVIAAIAIPAFVGYQQTATGMP